MTTATTKYGIDLRIDLGIGRQESRGAWDAGIWGMNVWGQSDTLFGDWVEVTCDVADPFTLTAGASNADGIVTRWEAATLGMTLYGDDYDPWNGPWAGVVGPGIAARVLWHPHPEITPPAGILPPPVAELPGWYPAFLGQVSGWEWEPVASGVCETTVAATDTTQMLVAYDAVAGATVGGAETAAARVTRILDMASWPSSLRNITAGGVKTRATTLEGVAWEQLLIVADTDLALLWMDRSGRVNYIPTGRVGAGTQLAARLVVCDEPSNPNDVQIVTMGGATFGNVRNVVSIAHAKDEGASTEPPVTSVRDDASIARYGRRAYSRTDLVYADTEEWWATVVANAVLMSSAWPSAAPREITLDSRLRNPTVPMLLLALEPNHTFDVVDTRGRIWRESTLGWDVEIGLAKITGTVRLDDISRWVAGKWDTAGWDREHWGFAITGG